MRRYETIFILDPDLSDEGRVPVFDRLNSLIPAQGGTLLEMDEWGARKLAYSIKKKPRGYYVRADYCGDGDVVEEMERFFRIDDRVLKYMTVLIDPEADLERLLAEMAEMAEPEPEAPAETAAAPEAADAGTAPAEASPAEATESAESGETEVNTEEPKTETTEETASNGPSTP
jgi:small subunit ribosomal protein S6